MCASMPLMCPSCRTGRVAGANMAGAQLRYTTLPVYTSEALGVEAMLVGDAKVCVVCVVMGDRKVLYT